MSFTYIFSKIRIVFRTTNDITIRITVTLFDVSYCNCCFNILIFRATYVIMSIINL